MSTSTENNNFSTTLFGKTRRAVLSLLYNHAESAFYLRQIARATGTSLGAVQRELKQLTDAGIIRRTIHGRQVYYQANTDSPVFRELKIIVASTAQIAPQLENSVKTTSPVSTRFAVSHRRLANFCRKHHIKRLALFGSVLRPDFRPDSDIDVLVEFEPSHVPGFSIVAMENELSRLINHKVDLRTPRDLSRYFREQVVREAKVEYVAPPKGKRSC